MREQLFVRTLIKSDRAQTTTVFSRAAIPNTRTADETSSGTYARGGVQIMRHIAGDFPLTTSDELLVRVRTAQRHWRVAVVFVNRGFLVSF